MRSSRGSVSIPDQGIHTSVNTWGVQQAVHIALARLQQSKDVQQETPANGKIPASQSHPAKQRGRSEPELCPGLNQLKAHAGFQ